MTQVVPPVSIPRLVSKGEVRRRLAQATGARIAPDVVDYVAGLLECEFSVVEEAAWLAMHVAQREGERPVRTLRLHNLKGYLVVQYANREDGATAPQEVTNGNDAPEV